MTKNIRTQLNKVVGKSLDAYHKRMKPTVDELKFKEQYQGRIIDCMVGEVDDNYIDTPETDAPIVKLEHSKEGVVKIPSIKGNTILVDADGNETDTPAEGCKLVSVGESEDNKLIIFSKNKNLVNKDMLMIGNLDGNGESTENINGFYLVTKDFINISGIEYISLRRALGTHEYSYHAQISFYDEIVDNKIIRRTCKYIITENTDIGYDTELNDRVGFVVRDSIINNQKLDGKIISDKFTYVVDTSDKYGSDYRITLGRIPNYPIVFTLPKDVLGINDEDIYSNFRIQKLKKWLLENPIEVLYELAEPFIEELPNSITQQGFDDTTMYIENSIAPTVQYGYNALIPYKQELLSQQEEVEINTLDIENNIIPYLMDMEFNLMLLEDN